MQASLLLCGAFAASMGVLAGAGSSAQPVRPTPLEA
jgi:hypothetical protein